MRSREEGLVIRPAVAEDLPDVIASMSACDKAPQWPSEAWEGFLGPDDDRQSKTGVLFVVRTAERGLSGWIAGSALGEVAELEFLLVSPAHRGLGLGRQLLRRWLTWAEERGAAEALLEVRASNEIALALYRSFGFEEQGRRRAYYCHPVEDAVLMTARLPLHL